MANKKAIAKKTKNLPSYIKQGQDRGSENVGIEDIVIPRIELAQDLSPCLKSSKAEYIEGSTAGCIYNNVTREIYKEGVLFVPVLFKKEYLIWKDRKEGGGFRGSFAMKAEAEAEILEIIKEAPGTYEAVETAQHIVLVADGDKIEEAVISMSRSKMKVSRSFNSLIRIVGGDRFSRMYKLTSVEDSSDLGEYHNFKIVNAGFPSEAVYLKAEKLYEDIMSGSVVAKVDESYDTDSDDNPPEESSGPTKTAGKSDTPF